MKALLLLILTLAGLARASTVVITMTGHVSATDAGQFFALAPVSVGDPWTVTVSYAHPNPPTAIFLEGPQYGLLGDRMTFSVNGFLWSGQLSVSAFVSTTPFDPFQEVGMITGGPVPQQITPGQGGSSSTLLHWTGESDMITDASSLPDSFAQWNFPAATDFSIEVINRYGTTGANFWRIHANSWDTISIQVIPEPATAGLLMLAGLAAAGRRCRVRA